MESPPRISAHLLFPSWQISTLLLLSFLNRGYNTTKASFFPNLNKCLISYGGINTGLMCSP